MLSDAQCRTAKPKERPYKLARELGLYLAVNPNGSKWWRFAYSFAGKEKLLSLGTYPDVPLSLARDRRDLARRMVAALIDPSVQRREEREAEAAAGDSFSAVVERWKTDELRRTTENYQRNVCRMLSRDVLPHIGTRPVDKIKARELVAIFDRIRERGTEETARRSRSIVGQIIRYAIRKGLAENDPTLALRGERRLKAVRHFPTFTEPADVARLMQAIYGYRGTATVCAAVKLSPILFQRPGEIRQMEWTQIDLDAAEWRYTTSKTKTAHIVPLPQQAVEILRELQLLTGHGLTLRPDAPRYVFPSPKSRLRPMSDNAVRSALRSMGFTNDEITPHGFRAMARSLLAERGWKIDAIERQLAHKAAGPLGAAYDRATYLDERRRMMQDWADYLDGLRTRSNVVPLRAA